MSYNATKLNGQIWIDKNSPYSLKYRYNNTNFTVQTYQPLDATSVDYNSTPTGTVLAFKPVGGNSNITVQPAHFPEDINNVIGLSMQKDGRVYLIDSGELTVNSNVFVGDLTLCQVGDPVYWYLDTYRTDINTKTSGKLTLLTPNMYSTVTTDNNTTNNIGYNNLPQVGTIKKKDGSNIIINVNFSSFDTSLEWFWPLNSHEEGATHDISCGYIEIIRNIVDSTLPAYESINLMHGLFVEQNRCDSENTIKCLVEEHSVSGENQTTIVKELQAAADFEHSYLENNTMTGTKFTISTIESNSYFVTGTVSYNLSRG